MQNIIRSSTGRLNLSNCFESAGNIFEEIEHSNFIIVNDSKPVILLKKHEEFLKMYYFLGSIGNFSALKNDDWKFLSGKILKISENENLPVYSDITLKGNFEYKGSIFEMLKFIPFRTYVRKSMLKPDKPFKEFITIEFAGPEDLKNIRSIIKAASNNFDTMADHLPNDDELKNLVLNRGILKAELENELAGVLFFTDTGIKSYISVLCVADRWRDKIIGYSLLANYLNRHMNSTKFFYLWVDEANKHVHKLHDYFGFRDDGLKNFIFRLGGD